MDQKQKHRIQRRAKIKYKMIKTDVENEKWYRNHRIWCQQKRFDKKLKEHVEGFVKEYQMSSVSRKKEIREVFT